MQRSLAGHRPERKRPGGRPPGRVARTIAGDYCSTMQVALKVRAPAAAVGAVPVGLKHKTPLASPPNAADARLALVHGARDVRVARHAGWASEFALIGDRCRPGLEAAGVARLRAAGSRWRCRGTWARSSGSSGCTPPRGGEAPDVPVVPAAVGRLVGRLARDHGADVADGGRLVGRHARPQETRDRDRSDDADDRHDDQQLDQGETLLLLHFVQLSSFFATGRAWLAPGPASRVPSGPATQSDHSIGVSRIALEPRATNNVTRPILVSRAAVPRRPRPERKRPGGRPPGPFPSDRR